MTLISKRQAAKLKVVGKLKPTEETLKKQHIKKQSKDLTRAVTAIESTSKTIAVIGTTLNKSVLKLLNKDLKVDIKTIESTKKKKWLFTVQRDQKGFIKTIEATETLK